MRLHAQTAMIENGFVHIPETAPWLAEYLHELTVFPKGKHDDQADSTAQFLDWFKIPMSCWGIFELTRQQAQELEQPSQTATRQDSIRPQLNGMASRAAESAVDRLIPCLIPRGISSNITRLPQPSSPWRGPRLRIHPPSSGESRANLIFLNSGSRPAWVSRKEADLVRNRRFESTSLQRRVREPSVQKPAPSRSADPIACRFCPARLERDPGPRRVPQGAWTKRPATADAAAGATATGSADGEGGDCGGCYESASSATTRRTKPHPARSPTRVPPSTVSPKAAPHSAPSQPNPDHSLVIRQRRDPPAAPCLWFRARAPAKGRS
jgi:hypothetical protein